MKRKPLVSVLSVAEDSVEIVVCSVNVDGSLFDSAHSRPIRLDYGNLKSA